MSSPWKWFGNEFPSLQQTISSAATGDGTDFQVIWNMNDGATTDDQICKFEWTAKTIALAIAGTATMPFLVASTGLTESHAVPFSHTVTFGVNSATSTWDGNEVPNGQDYPLSSNCSFGSSSNSFVVPVTLSDGSVVNAGFNIAAFMGAPASHTPGASGLYGITQSLVGRIYGQYTKEVVVDFFASSNTATITDPNNIQMTLNNTAFPGTPIPLGPQTVFHTTAMAYYFTPLSDGSTLSISAFNLLVTASSTTPPNI